MASIAAPRFSPFAALALLWRGLTVVEVAGHLGCSRQTVYKLLAKARRAEVHMGPPRHLTPVNLGVFSRCNHKAVPMNPGDPFYCVECHASGWDFHPKLQALPLAKDKKKYRPGKLKGGK